MAAMNSISFRLDADLLNHFPVETDIVPANPLSEPPETILHGYEIDDAAVSASSREVGVPNFYFERKRSSCASGKRVCTLPVRWGFWVAMING